MFLVTLPGIITSTISHLSFQLSVIERMILELFLISWNSLFDLCFSKPIYKQKFDP